MTVDPSLADEPVGQLDVPGVELLQVLGHGGFGSVFLAYQPAEDRHVAVKVLYTLLSDSIEAFEREARMLGRLSGHPNVVDVYEAGRTIDGRPYLVIEYVDGGSLTEVMKDGSARWQDIVGYGIDIARGLEHAHSNGVVHRDVKPSNVLVTTDGVAKLNDFGIAQLEQNDPTVTGAVMMTVKYAPPEIFQGQPARPASDVYSLGATLYAVLAGHAPHEAGNDSPTSIWSLVNRIANEDPPPLEPWCAPPAVRSAIQTALQRDAARRPVSAAAFGDLLQEALVNGESEPMPVRPTPTPVITPPLDPSELPAAEAPGAEWPAGELPDTDVPAWLARPPEWSYGSDDPGGPGAGSQLDPPTAVAPPPPPEAQPPEARPAETQPPPDGAWCDLTPSFRFVHGPLVATETGVPFVGSQDLVDQLTSRLRYSRSGAILVTGFRGAGKTTLVRRAIDQLESQPSDDHIVSVLVNVARPTTIQDLLTMIVRQLFERLTEEQLMPKVDPRAARALVLAYLRTSVQLKQSQGMTGEVGSSLGFEKWGMKLGLSGKTVETLASEAQYVAYSEADLEYDLLRTAVMLAHPTEAPAEARSWWQRLFGPGSAPAAASVRTIVVIDELDKLTSTTKGMEALDELLSSFKNVLAGAGLTFIFVGGADLHDRYRVDIQRGNSIYESVFSWHLYVPCQWDAPDRLLDHLIEQTTRIERAVLRSAIRYECRGLHRRMLQHVNRLVVWGPHGPRLEMSERDLERISLQAEIDALVCDDEEIRTTVGRASIEADRRLLSNYYVADWILRTAGSEFAVADLARHDPSSGAHLAIDPLLRVDLDEVASLVARMEAAGVVFSSPNPLPDVPLSYSLSPSYAERVTRAGLSETPLDDLQLDLFDQPVAATGTPPDGPPTTTPEAPPAPDSGPPPAPQAPPAPTDPESDRPGPAIEGGRDQTLRYRGDFRQASAEVDGDTPYVGVGAVLADRYEILDVLDLRSLGTVYRGRDRVGRGEVAIKIMSSPTLLSDERARARLEREVEIAKHLDHPRIVRTVDVIDLGALGPARVMEYPTGTDLDDVISNGTVETADAVKIGLGLAHAVGYLADRGVTRLGLSPSQIVVDPEGQPKVVDFGLARRAGLPLDEITERGLVVGDLAYLAPEQQRGEPGDTRGDLYSIGVLMLELLMVRGAGPSNNPDWIELLPGRASVELQAALVSVLDPDPEARPATANKLIDLLSNTPEGRSLRDAGVALVDQGLSLKLSSPSGPQPEVEVQGVLCPRGHFNNPAAAYCQVCSISMVQVTLQLVSGPRPTLGFIVFDDGTTVALDRGQLIGREPTIDLTSDLAPLVVSGNNETLSRRHAELRLVDWEVVLTDLGSTNGTFVWDRANEQWVTLVPHEPVRLQSGDTVSLGRRSFTFEAMTRNLIPETDGRTGPAAGTAAGAPAHLEGLGDGP